MQAITFPTSYDEILKRVDEIDPVKYAGTRNFIDGGITYLSPYISRGAISTKQVLEKVLANGFSQEQAKKFIQELAWREYFQRVWQSLGDKIFDDIRFSQPDVQHHHIPVAIVNAATGVRAVDDAISNLYNTGYMHNHLRMYTASIACNIGKAHWHVPSKWMYYYLLDGDLASNMCSWQWIAGSFSSKKYFCNQENINKYTGTLQQNTFLDKSYEALPLAEIPAVLTETTLPDLTATLPQKEFPKLDNNLPLLLYNSYNLDPLWKNNMHANRVLLLEPSHFAKYPVSKKVIDFIIALATNIDGLQIFVGEVDELISTNLFPAIYSKEHPAFKHYPGVKDERDWLFEEVTGYYNSFSAFWKKCEKELKEW